MALSGEILDPGQYATDIRKLIARGVRLTSSTGSTGTETPVLRLDSIAVKTGRAYHVATPTLLVTSNAGDVVGLRFRYTTDGSTAVITSTVLRYAQTTIRTGTPDEPIAISEDYFPSADQTLSILLTVHRIGGAGTSVISAAADKAIRVSVYDDGEDTGDIGVSL